jgi:hypothetical protein
LRRLRLQPDERRLAEQITQALLCQTPKRRTALAEEIKRIGLRGFGAKPERQFIEWRIERRVERERGLVRGVCTLPHHMQHHVAEIRVRVVPVRAPVGTAEIEFNITAARRIGVELDHRAAKVRPGLAVPEARMQHPHRAALRRAQAFALDALMKPNGLEQALGWWLAAIVQ